MNFWVLKNMVDNLVSTYKCPFCSSCDISEQDIDIVWAAGNTVNIDMHCPKCKKHFMAKTELMHIELGSVHPDSISKINESLHALKGKLWWNIEINTDLMKSEWDEKKEDIIDDTQIIDLNTKLSGKNMKIEDLLSDTQEDASWNS